MSICDKQNFKIRHQAGWFKHNLVTNMEIRPQGYKTIFMLNWAEHKIYPAHKC